MTGSANRILDGAAIDAVRRTRFKEGRQNGVPVRVWVMIPIRFRLDVVRPLPPLLEHIAQQFKWEKHGGESFDLVLVRARNEPDPVRLAGAPGRLVLRDHRERWWLYERALPR